MAAIRERIRSCDAKISEGMPKILHHDCSAGPMEERCQYGQCRKTEPFVYNNTLDAAHEKLRLTMQLGEEGRTELPGVLVQYSIQFQLTYEKSFPRHHNNTG